VADVIDCLHPEVRGVEVCRVQLFQVPYGTYPTALFQNEKDESDITERQKKEWNHLYGPLEEEGFYLLIDIEIVLALRGGAEIRARQRKRREGGEVRAESIHGLQSVMGAAKDVSPKRGEVSETTPHPQGCMRRGWIEMAAEICRPGSAGGTGQAGHA
jgi:hypothetical protein